ncbi:MAG: hypothetical protein HXX11_02585 [Desulfuromonadales bacterium]|nr:hypothetical protein [Desulfuromonadales bacterium]
MDVLTLNLLIFELLDDDHAVAVAEAKKLRDRAVASERIITEIGSFHTIPGPGGDGQF